MFRRLAAGYWGNSLSYRNWTWLLLKSTIPCHEVAQSFLLPPVGTFIRHVEDLMWNIRENATPIIGIGKQL